LRRNIALKKPVKKTKTKAKAKVKAKANTKVAKKKPVAKAASKAKPNKKSTVKKRAVKKTVKKAVKRVAAKKALKKPAPKKAVVKKVVPKKIAAKKPVAAKQAVAVAAIKPKWPALVESLLAKLDEAKAEQIVAVDVRGKSTEADTMVVASGRSNRHVNAIADQCVEALEKQGVKNIRIEGVPQCDWVLVDAGDIVLHVFRPEVRSFYNLEKLWSAHVPE
jgi:ribosome-associated protein